MNLISFNIHHISVFLHVTISGEDRERACLSYERSPLHCISDLKNSEDIDASTLGRLKNLWPRACGCSEVTAWVPREGGTQGKECLLPSLKLSSAVDGRRTEVNTSPHSHSCACLHAKSLQSCPTLCDPMAPLSMGFSRQEYWSGSPCPP